MNSDKLRGERERLRLRLRLRYISELLILVQGPARYKEFHVI